MILGSHESQFPVAIKVDALRSVSFCLAGRQHSSLVILERVKLDVMMRGWSPYVISLRTNDRGYWVC